MHSAEKAHDSLDNENNCKIIECCNNTHQWAPRTGKQMCACTSGLGDASQVTCISETVKILAFCSDWKCDISRRSVQCVLVLYRVICGKPSVTWLWVKLPRQLLHTTKCCSLSRRTALPRPRSPLYTLSVVYCTVVCHLMCLVVTLKLCKEYLKGVARNTPALLQMKNWTVKYVKHLYVLTSVGVRQTFNNSLVFGPPCISYCHYDRVIVRECRTEQMASRLGLWVHLYCEC